MARGQTATEPAKGETVLPRLPFASYHGRTVRMAELADVALAEISYAPQLCLPAHAHEHAIFCFGIDGSCTERVRGGERTLEPSTFRYHPPGEVHADLVHDAGWRIFAIQFRAAELARFRDADVVLDEAKWLRDVRLCGIGRRLYREFLLMDSASPLAIEGLLIEAGLAAARRGPGFREQRLPSWLARADELLRTRFHAPVAMGELAREVGVHPVHLARVFHVKFGRTMGDYVRELRVDFACRQMRATALPLGTIAAASGFADQSHFCRTFKRVFGMTPTEYRTLTRD